MFLYKYLVAFICLNAFVGSVWSNSSKGTIKSSSDGCERVDTDTCVQKTVSDKCCKLPFTYRGKTYNSCTTDDSGVLGELIFGNFWCYYDQDKHYERCKAPIYLPTQPTPSTKPRKEQNKLSQSSSSLDVTVTSVLVPVISSHKAHSSRLSIFSPLHSTTMILTRSGTKKVEKRCSKRDLTKQRMYIILACGFGGGIFLVMDIALITVIIYLKRKNKMKVKREEEEKGDQHEMTSGYRLRKESNNSVYESIDN